MCGFLNLNVNQGVITAKSFQTTINNWSGLLLLAMVILTGDFNPTSTGLCSDSIARPNHLKQLVKFNTRDSGILDWFFTNRPHTFNLQRLPKLGASDHYTVLANSTVKHPPQHNSVKKVYRRQCRASNWREFGSWITTKD